MNLKIRDRRYVSHAIQQTLKGPEDPQGHPPSTFLFLPMKLSNSKTGQITAPTSKRQDQNPRIKILGPKSAETNPLWLLSQPNLKVQLETRQRPPLSPRRRRRWVAYKTHQPEPSSGKIQKTATILKSSWFQRGQPVPRALSRRRGAPHLSHFCPVYLAAGLERRQGLNKRLSLAVSFLRRPISRCVPFISAPSDLPLSPGVCRISLPSGRNRRSTPRENARASTRIGVSRFAGLREPG